MFWSIWPLWMPPLQSGMPTVCNAYKQDYGTKDCFARHVLKVSMSEKITAFNADVVNLNSKVCKKASKKKYWDMRRLPTRKMVFGFMSLRIRRGYVYVARLISKGEGCMAGRPAGGIAWRQLVVK